MRTSPRRLPVVASAPLGIAGVVVEAVPIELFPPPHAVALLGLAAASCIDASCAFESDQRKASMISSCKDATKDVEVDAAFITKGSRRRNKALNIGEPLLPEIDRKRRPRGCRCLQKGTEAFVPCGFRERSLRSRRPYCAEASAGMILVVGLSRNRRQSAG